MFSGLLRLVSTLALAGVLNACGGGGGGDAASPAVPAPAPAAPAPTTPTPAPSPEPPPGQPALSPLASASRLASRATFGLDYPAIQAIAEQGEAAWLEEQFRLPIGRH